MQYERHLIIKTVRKNLTAAWIVCAAFILMSCGSRSDAATQQPEAVEAENDKLDFSELEARDTAVFMEYEERLGTVKLMSVDNGRSYTVSINNLSVFEDNYGKVTVPELFEMGMIVDVDVSVHSRTIKSMQQDPDAFLRRDVTGFEINPNRGVFSTDDGTNLHITENTVVIKGDKTVRLTDISDDDVLLLRGTGHELYSIRIMSGYGHLRIRGAEYFTGGWVRIADMFKPVSEDMLLDVPEGEYDMMITYKGQGGTRHVVINRGKETSVDVSDLKGELIKTGEIVFTIRPLSADPEVRIDGEIVDHMHPVELEYGVYQLEITAEGYTAVRERIAVGSEAANLDIELAESEETTDVSDNKANKPKAGPDTVSAGNLPTSFIEKSSSSSSEPSYGVHTGSSSGSSSSSVYSGSSLSSSGSSSVSSDNAVSIVHGSRIYIDAPETAEVYFDGIYKGIVPCSFIKESGTHVITLRKDGYEPRTFTVTIANSSENETYSFSELQEE